MSRIVRVVSRRRIMPRNAPESPSAADGSGLGGPEMTPRSAQLSSLASAPGHVPEGQSNAVSEIGTPFCHHDHAPDQGVGDEISPPRPLRRYREERPLYRGQPAGATPGRADGTSPEGQDLEHRRTIRGDQGTSRRGKRRSGAAAESPVAEGTAGVLAFAKELLEAQISSSGRHGEHCCPTLAESVGRRPSKDAIDHPTC